MRVSTIARRSESRGAPTRETMAIKFAPIAMAMALGALVTARPNAKTATNGSTVIAPATGVMSEKLIFSELRGADWVLITEIAPPSPVEGGVSSTPSAITARYRHDRNFSLRQFERTKASIMRGPSADARRSWR